MGRTAILAWRRCGTFLADLSNNTKLAERAERMRFSHRLMAVTTMLFGAGLAGPAPVAADELRPRVVAAEMGAADAFPGRGKLNDAELKAVSGFGADASGEAGAPETGDVSVILFDELGRPKRNGLSPGSGGSSTVVRGVHVHVGR